MTCTQDTPTRLTRRFSLFSLPHTLGTSISISCLSRKAGGSGARELPASVKLRRQEIEAKLAGSIVRRLLAAERSVRDCNSDMRGWRKRSTLLSRVSRLRAVMSQTHEGKAANWFISSARLLRAHNLPNEVGSVVRALESTHKAVRQVHRSPSLGWGALPRADSEIRRAPAASTANRPTAARDSRGRGPTTRCCRASCRTIPC